MKKVLQLSNINPCVLEAQYAVRGQVVVKALEIEEQLKSKKTSFPFDEVIYCNIGNPQQLGQKPLSFHRNVLSLCTSPELLQNTYVKKMFSEAVITRAQEILAGIDGNTGAYTHSQGLPSVRKNVAKFIEERDGYPSNYERIFLTDGASPGIQLVLKTLITNKKDAILIPIPQYPLYSASIDLFGGSQAHYYLNEQNIWGMDLEELEKGYKAAKDKGLNVRALVVINPGNPTGQILTSKNQQQIIEFCVKNGLVLLADEVYQENIYDDSMKFNSFKKVACEMGGEFHPDNFEMFSFHSISKGFLGECGRRGGYMEVSNGVDPTIMEQLYKVASINLCPNVDGQIMMDLKIKPPKGDEVYEKEKKDILDSLKRRSIALVKALNELKGVSCQPALGAMYVFPNIKIPEKAIKVATEKGMKPDMFYSLSLLSESGICVVPGSGFGQRDGTYHFRTTFLPPENKMEVVCSRLKEFHNNFLKKYE
jgi:alanine transaminase